MTPQLPNPSERGGVSPPSPSDVLPPRGTTKPSTAFAAARGLGLHGFREWAAAGLVGEGVEAFLDLVEVDLSCGADFGGEVLKKPPVPLVERDQRLIPRTQPRIVPPFAEEGEELFAVVEVEENRAGAVPVVDCKDVFSVS
jgi:hypothetical protein